MSFGAIAIGVGTAATVGSSIAGAKAQSKANKNNRRAQQDANQLNYDMFRESRGEGGSAVLPLYLQAKDGGLFEKQLGEDLVDMWGSTAPDRAAFNAVQAGYRPMVAGARDTAAGIFDGRTERQMLDNFAPVAKARTVFKRQAAIDALNKTLGEIDAVQAGRGFSSDSLGKRMLTYRANAGAGDAIAGARLQNLEEERAIRDAMLNLRLSSLNLPFAMAGQEADFENLGNAAYLDAFSKRMVPLNFLRIGTSQPFQYQPLRYEANPSAGQLALQGLGQLGGMGANYFMQKQQNQDWQNWLGSMQNAPFGSGGSSINQFGGVTTPIAYNTPGGYGPVNFGN